MKKIFTYLAVAALMAVACEDMYGPVETPTTPDKAGSVEIQIDTLGDDTLKFTLAPVGEASYFSYVVAAGSAKAVDSVAVYQCKVDGMIKGTYLASENPSVTLALGELAPNSPYTIYAVAGSPQGIPGSVAVKEVKTTDGITIGITSFEAVTDSSVVLSFSEQVFLGEGKITATYYASNLGYQAAGTVEAVADSILVDGKTVTVQFAGLPAGAHWALSYPEGMFTDSANNKIAALTSGYSAENKKFVGVSARKDTVAFDLVDTLATEQLMFNDWQTAMFSVEVAGDQTLAAYGSAQAVVNYITPGKVLTIDLTPDQNYGIFASEDGTSGVGMFCPEAPAFGTTVVFSFPQDAFQDIWGNPTKAVEYASLCAYDYTIETVCGYYKMEFYSYFYGSAYGWLTESMKIEPLDGAEWGNVQITEFYGIPCETPIVAEFEPASGLLTIPSGQYFADGQDYYYGEDGNPVMGEDGNPIILDVALVFGTYSDADLVMQMPEAGVLTYETSSTDGLVGIFEYYGTQFYNYYDMIIAIDATQTEEPAAEEPAPAALSAKREMKKNVL